MVGQTRQHQLRFWVKLGNIRKELVQVRKRLLKFEKLATIQENSVKLGKIGLKLGNNETYRSKTTVPLNETRFIR